MDKSPRLQAATLVLAGILSGAAHAGDPPLPVLRINTPFAQPGQPVTLTIQTEPGAQFSLFVSAQPAESAAGVQGTLFLKQGTMIAIGGGVADGSGAGSRQLNIPGGLAPGRIFYAQARATIGTDIRLSNSVVFRIATAQPAGRRVTVAVDGTPDGRRIYVAHQVDGSVSVIDPVARQHLTELPLTLPTPDLPHRPLRVRIDPEGRHAFVVNANATTLPVIHTASDSVSAQIPVPRGSRGIGFDFSSQRLIYVANETAGGVLEIREDPLGTFTRVRTIPLEGHAPGPLLVLGDRRIAVGHRDTHDVEILDPAAPAGQQTIARIALGGLPYDLLEYAGEILVPTFAPSTTPGLEGFNRVLRIDLAALSTNGFLFEDIGTDYIDIARVGDLLAVVAASSGTVLFADGITAVPLQNVELAPGLTATPQDAFFLAGPGAGEQRLYVANYFRETLRPIRVDTGPPYTLESEIPLAWSGQVRVPLSGALTAEEDGDWFFRSVNLFGASALAPNRVSCFTCHVDGASDNITRNRQVPPGWGLANTAPYGWNGGGATLLGLIRGAMNAHNSTGTPSFPGADLLVQSYLAGLQPPPSIYLTASGGLSPAAAAGKTLFEGLAQCTGCHVAPVFIPPAGDPPTIAAGIGTGLVPANVPSLRGAWATAPYLHNGSALTLMDVLTINPADTHGQLAGALTAGQRQQLVAYLLTL